MFLRSALWVTWAPALVVNIANATALDSAAT
jgi:hypothetical protein